MLRPLIQRAEGTGRKRPLNRESGVTMALVAVSIVALISMAVLSIDVGTLYEAKVEAQRSADAAALAAARQISISGITGDPGNATSSWQDICGGPGSVATLTATSVAQQNLINGSAPSTVIVNYGTNSGPPADTNCSALGSSFGINRVVSVYVQQAKLPTFFSHVFSLLSGGSTGNSGVSATAYAEVFNSSDSSTVAGKMMPVQPRCVKPWIVPNQDPGNGGTPFVSTVDGSIVNKGVNPLGAGVIGETFNLRADCAAGSPECLPIPGTGMFQNPPRWNAGAAILTYIPAAVQGNPSAVPSCAIGNSFQQATAGCDETTNYACGTPSGAQADLKENPLTPAAGTGDSATSVSCLTQSTPNYLGADTLPTTTYPFQVQAGLGNPLVRAGLVANNSLVSSSNSIVTLPVFDDPIGGPPLAGANPAVTVVGFLQVFINAINPNGSVNVTVLNVSGCSKTAAGNPTVSGTSPVPIRLITSP